MGTQSWGTACAQQVDRHPSCGDPVDQCGFTTAFSRVIGGAVSLGPDEGGGDAAGKMPPDIRTLCKAHEPGSPNYPEDSARFAGWSERGYMLDALYAFEHLVWTTMASFIEESKCAL